MAHHWRKWRQARFVLHSLLLNVQSFKILSCQAVFFSRRTRNTEIYTPQASYACPPRYSVNWRRLSSWISFSNNRKKSYLYSLRWLSNMEYFLQAEWELVKSGHWRVLLRCLRLGHTAAAAVYALSSISLNRCCHKLWIQIWIWTEFFKVRSDEETGSAGAVFTRRSRRHDPSHHS